MWLALKRAGWFVQLGSCLGWCLTSESVEGTSLPLEGIDNVHGGDGLPLGVFGVGDGVPDDVLKENLEDTTGLLVDESGDTLDSTTTSQTSDGGLGDTLDVISQHLTVTLGASLSESLASFAASSHVASYSKTDVRPTEHSSIYTLALLSYWPGRSSQQWEGIFQRTLSRPKQYK